MLGSGRSGTSEVVPPKAVLGAGGNNERNHLGPRGTMREISIIVENSAVCLGPAAQGRQKLFPRRLFKGLGGTMKEMTKGQGEQGAKSISS